MGYKNQCPNCGGYKKAQYPLCYSCQLNKRQNDGFFKSLFIFLYLPCIPTVLFIAFGKAFSEAGFPIIYQILFGVAATVIIAIIKWQEVDNIKKQWNNRNW
jgi:hypothetical protein